MRIAITLPALFALMLMGHIGCSSRTEPAPLAASPAVTATPPVAAKPVAPATPARVLQEPLPTVEGSAPPAPVPAAGVNEQVVAQQGVGIKGRSLDQYEGVVVTPVKSLFAAKERLVFEIEVPKALQLFKATDPQGQGPATSEIFMKEVIEANQIKLPKLPENQRYLYDPKTEQLMVERPKAVAAPQQ